MQYKISIIIPYGIKYNENELKHWKKLIKEVRRHKHLFTTEFPKLYLEHIQDAETILDFTLSSLSKQTFKDFEILVVSKYPNELLTSIKKWKNLNIKLIKDKYTVWRSLDRFALQNARNTGIIHSNGELILFLDPYQIFNKFILQEAWDAWDFRKAYLTFQHITRIYYGIDDEIIQNWIDFHGKWRKILRRGKWGAMINMPGQQVIPQSYTWGYGFTVHIDDILKLNGFDEIYDGNYGSDDGEFGWRLSRLKHSKSNTREVSKNILYELSYNRPLKKSWKELDRDNSIILRYYTHQKKHDLRANIHKPSKEFIENYPKIYFNKWNKRLEDKNWNLFMKTKSFNLMEERKKLNLGKIIWYSEK